MISDQREQTLILMRGLPRSGKSTKAIGLGFPVVCEDAADRISLPRGPLATG